jgi:rhodanese-related sulfurtransferase
MVAQRYGIQSIPTLVLFENGEPKQAVQGALPKPQLVQFLEQSVSKLAPPTITVDALAERLRNQQPVRILDGRAEADYHRAHLPGAEHADPETLPEVLTEGTEPVVLVCRAGADSEALAKAHADGAREVQALKGGLLEWQGAGHDTFSTAEEQAARA